MHGGTHESVTLTFVDYGGTEGTSVPYSLSRLVAPSEDVVWLVDPNQAAAKLYDADGGLVRFVGRPVPPGQPDDRDPTQRQQVRMPDGTWSVSPVESLDLTQDFCATPDGRTFVSDSRSRTVLVFDEDGNLEHDAWRHLEGQVRALTGHEIRPKPPTIYVDRYGCLYLHIRGPYRSRYFLVKFDPDLECLGTRPGFSPGWDGWTYEWVGSGGVEGPNDVLRVYDADGQSCYELAIVPPVELAGGDYDPACRHWEAADSAHYDAAGNIYMVLSVPRETPLAIASDLTVERDIAVYKFDAAGGFVAKLILEGTPFYMHPRIAVDPQGNIYHVRALAGGIEIIKEKLVGLEAGSAPGEPDYAALRQALEPTGWRVHWLASKGCAVASKRHARVEVRPGPEPAILNGRDIPLPYPAKIVDGQLQVPAVLLARLEKFVEGGLQAAPEPFG
jgi:hypothetical protein